MIQFRYSRTTVGVFDDNAWSTEAREWDVCCAAPNPTMSTEMCVAKRCTWTSIAADPLSGTDFALLSGRVSDVFSL
ncbi:hypothetical protein TNCV_1053331 [Trichonephila clavipes]|nr:hypothetical protein TNCV_1053331 [Trichonephila clavipes]